MSLLDGRAPPRSCYVFGFLDFSFFLKDLGPCFGMNGHPRMATDVILRLSRSKKRFAISFYRFWKLK